MLTAYRRHLKNCRRRDEGRSYRNCRCPIWVDGILGGAEIRESLKVRDWQRAQEIIREWEIESPHISADKEIYAGSVEGIPSGHRGSQTQRLYGTKIQVVEPPNGRVCPTTRSSCPCRL